MREGRINSDRLMRLIVTLAENSTANKRIQKLEKMFGRGATAKLDRSFP